MSVIRQQNWLQQQRVDVPHLRSVESSICADFDLLAGSIFGGSRALVVQGFDLIPASNGTAATSLQLHTAGGVLVHALASESGSIFSVPPARAAETLNASNPRVTGSFAASAVNYVGVDLRRTADATTTDLVQFLDANTLVEKPKSVPLGRTLDYVIVVSTQDFSSSPNIAPLAKVTTDSSGNITALEDARNLTFRLGTGGTITAAKAAYPWPNGRHEVGDNSDFNVGDKTISSLKDWMDAVMTRMWELGGGEYWYSPTADRNVQMIRGYGGASPFTGGEYFEWTGTNLHWQGLAFQFDNSTGHVNQVADQTGNSSGLTDLADGECVYVDLDRTANKTGGSSIHAVKGVLATLGTPVVPGSRYVIALRSGSLIFTRDQYFPVGSAFAVATTTALGVVKLSVASGTPLAPVVFNPDSNGNLTVTSTGGSSAAITATGYGLQAGISALGGASSGGGPGAVIAGQGEGTGIVVQGGPNGPGIVASGTLALGGGAPGPIFLAQDEGGARWQVDRIGFPAGPVMSRFEDWVGMTSTISTPSTLTIIPGTPFSSYGNGGTGSSLTPAIFVAPSGQWDGPGIQFASGTNGSNFTGVSTRNFIPAFTNGGENYVFSAEWVAMLPGSVPSGNTVSMGVIDSVASGFGAASNFAIFRADSSGSNWKIYIVGGAFIAFTTTTAKSITSPHRFRIEMHATGSPLAVALGYPVIIFMIDGIEVYRNPGTSAHFPGNNLRLAFECFNTTTNNTQLYLGPVSYGMAIGL